MRATVTRMRLVLVATAMAVLVTPAAVSAAPPPNDNYLASTSVADASRPLPSEYSDSVDTTDATTQVDLFNPDKDGFPLGGGGAESTACGSTSYDKTAWWDFRPQSPGRVEI